MSPVLQGSALWRAPDLGFTKIQAEGGRRAATILSAKLPSGSCARDWCPKEHAKRVVVSSGTMRP
jgi:hypothetical protein